MTKFEKWYPWETKFAWYPKCINKQWIWGRFYKSRIRYAVEEYEDEYGVFAEYQKQYKLI